MKKVYIPLILGIAAAIGVLVGGVFNFARSSEELFTKNSKKDKLNRLIDYIEYEYVDEVDTDSIVDVTVNDILDKLDPHSVYISQEQREEVSRNMQGDFVGVGISFYMYRDSLTVIRALEEGPSVEAGIKAGDRILMADKDTLYGKGFSSEKVIERLKGIVNSAVQLTVYRRGEPDLLSFNIRRARVPIKSVNAFYMITDKLGYIKVNRFAETTYDEFKEALGILIDNGMTQLALDLRDNSGGYLGIAEEITDEFLPENTMILFTKNKQGNIKHTYATDEGDFEEGHVYVLINELSASASEIVAGALQDNDKGTIVGRRSFGKGLVQREMSLGDGSAVRLTVSRYYTPTGRSIQRPYSEGNKKYYEEIYERYHNGEMRSADSISLPDSLKFVTPKGKVVHGGGGIIPDVFVPLNNTLQEEALEYLVQSAFLNNFVFEYLDADRDRFQEYSSAQDFIENAVMDDIILDAFKAYCLRNHFTMEIDKYHLRIRQIIKATIGLQLFNNNTYNRILNEGDIMIDKVIELSKRTF